MEGDVKAAGKVLQDEAMKRYNEDDSPLDQLRSLIDSVEDLEGWFKERGLDEEEIIHECKPAMVGAIQAVGSGIRPRVALSSLVVWSFQLGYATKEMHTARAGEGMPDPS